MENSIRGLRILWGALLASVVVYAALGEVVPHRELSPNLAVFKLIVVISIVTVVLILVMRRLTAKALIALRADQGDTRNVSRWRAVALPPSLCTK